MEGRLEASYTPVIRLLLGPRKQRAAAYLKVIKPVEARELQRSARIGIDAIMASPRAWAALGEALRIGGGVREVFAAKALEDARGCHFPSTSTMTHLDLTPGPRVPIGQCHGSEHE